jgi:hypothetical protein
MVAERSEDFLLSQKSKVLMSKPEPLVRFVQVDLRPSDFRQIPLFLEI